MIADSCINQLQVSLIYNIYFRMGNCLEKNKTFSNQKNPNFLQRISSLAQSRFKLIQDNFRIYKELSKMLHDVAYTQNQAVDLAKALVQGIISVQQQQTAEEKQEVQQLFCPDSISLIQKQQLFYQQMLEKLNKTKTEISPSSKSRVYHRIANLKKQIDINKEWRNAYKIDCIKSNDYKKISDLELEQIVKYETISYHIGLMGDNIHFRFSSISKESQKMIRLLSGCLVKHIDYINNLKYDLETNQVMKMAEISKQACNQYDNGVFILLIYFVQSCKNLQEKKVTSKEIDDLLNDAISRISEKYPPGKGLSKENESLISTLNYISDKNNYNRVDFSHSESVLQQEEKQLQLEKIITQYASIAEECKHLFQELVRATCLEKCVYFKIGLKYYPKNPNPKALTRIKEKMLLKESKCQFDLTGSRMQILKRQQANYRKIVDEKLSQSRSITFAISDMVRGKCVFLEIADIISTVQSIKEYVAKDSRFALKEIQNRFTNFIPISDVTLKIVIDNKIVAQLQLTIQTNAATYNFAHKIYQLQRSKVFSKIKIIDNYFQESKNDFRQLASKALSLISAKADLSIEDKICIKKYLQLDQASSKSFEAILSEVLTEKEKQVSKLVCVVDPLLQDLMLGIFCIHIKLWYKVLGKVIDSALKNQMISPILKSVLLSRFVEVFQLSKESEHMEQFGIMRQQLETKIFMQEYILEKFSIQKAFKFGSQNQKSFNRVKQLQQIVFLQRFESGPIELQRSKFVVNLVIEQACPESIERLKELFYFYFVTRDYRFGKEQIHPQFSRYYNWINSQIEENKMIDYKLMKSQIAIIKAQQLLENNEIVQSQKILENALQIFKSRQLQDKVLECDILLTQCLIKTSSSQLQTCIKEHQLKVLKKAETLGLQIKGALYAGALWRISEFLWKRTPKNQMKRLLDTFTTMAFKQMSRSKGKQLIYAMCSKWDQYSLLGSEQCQLQQNPKIIYIRFSGLKDKDCKYLNKTKWENLTTLDLTNNNIGPIGCEHLCKSNWKNLSHLYLTYSQIGDDGCKHFSQAKWNLTQLFLGCNNLGPISCLYLSQAQWNNLSFLDLGQNKIGDDGCEHLAKAQWNNLIHLNISANNIGTLGCEHLSKIRWKNLSQLHLNDNKIDENGVKHLSQAKWTNLKQFNLNNNSIRDEGCKYLSQSKWSNLTNIGLLQNNIGEDGCEYLSKTCWEKLVILCLNNNSIGDIGCQHLSKANWQNLNRLGLERSNIGAKGCEHLMKAKWQKLAFLHLSVNNVGDEGCLHLSRAKWDQLTKLYLTNNYIGDIGCRNLSSAHWSNLTYLDLSVNRIGDEGCDYLSKAQWNKLTYLDIRERESKRSSREIIKAKFTQKGIKVETY